MAERYFSIALDDEDTYIRTQEAAQVLRACADEPERLDSDAILARDLIFGQVNEAIARRLAKDGDVLGTNQARAGGVEA